jgi:hypothetical protein
MLTHEQWMSLHSEAHRLDADRATSLLAYAKALRVLGPNSVALVDDVVRRLVVGMPLGDWDAPLDLVANAIEETVDATDYITVELLRVEARANALRRARDKVLEADSALRDVARPPAEPLSAGG